MQNFNKFYAEKKIKFYYMVYPSKSRNKNAKKLWKAKIWLINEICQNKMHTKSQILGFLVIGLYIHYTLLTNTTNNTIIWNKTINPLQHQTVCMLTTANTHEHCYVRNTISYFHNLNLHLIQMAKLNNSHKPTHNTDVLYCKLLYFMLRIGYKFKSICLG